MPLVWSYSIDSLDWKELSALYDAAPLGKETRTTPGFDEEDPTSFWRHGRIGDWKRYGNDRFKQWFKDAAGEVLVECGYEKDGNW